MKGARREVQTRGSARGIRRTSGEQRNRDQPRHERQLVRICGLAAVRALFERDSGRVERLFFEAGMKAETGLFCRALADSHKPYRQVEPTELARIAGTVLHGGIVAVARRQALSDFDPSAARTWAKDGKPLLILDGVSNPHNLGAIIRTAAFFGLERILLAQRPGQALPSDASYRIAEGGFEHVNLYRAPLPDALGELRRVYRVIGAAPGKNATLNIERSARPLALVLGNEETGIAAHTAAVCDEIVTIAGSGGVQSLNVAAAAAILIYLATRS
jgi:TrmH RNA methyltransferase